MNNELNSEIIAKFEAGEPPSSIKKWIAEQTGYKKTKSNEIFNEVIAATIRNADNIFDFDLSTEDSEKADQPYFNQITRKYVVFIKALGKNIVISEETHKKILQMYSDWDGDAKTLNEICRALSLPRQILTEYIKKFGITHDSLPITDQDLDEADNEELESRLRELRKFSISQKLEKEGWDDIKKDAQKWRGFKLGIYEPFVDAINSWQPPKIKAPTKRKAGGNNSLIVALNDLHYGALCNPKEMFRETELNSNIIDARMSELADRIVEDAAKQNLNKIVILFLGDILNSANTQGTTNKGTILENDLKGGTLFKFALDSLFNFLQKILTAKVSVYVRGVSGNHDAALGAGLIYALEAAYREHTDKINFDFSDKYIADFVDGPNSFVYTHGAHWDVKSKVPSSGNKLKDYGQSLFLEVMKRAPEVKNKYLLAADLHHASSISFNDFDYYLLPSITGGSHYSDTLNLHSRPAQQTFLYDENGIKSVNNYFFD